MSFSFWEQNTFIKKPDVVIIGSGIVGLNAAIALKRKSPGLHILVLERGMLPYGASTRNAGFACIGSVSELLNDLETLSEQEVFSLVEKRWSGLQSLRKLVGDRTMNYEPLGGYEVFTNNDEELFLKCMDAVPRFNQLLMPLTGIENTYRIVDDKINSFGFKGIRHIIENKGEGQIDTGLMMKSLLQIALKEGIEVLNGANVESITPLDNGVDIQIIENTNKSEFQIRCKRAVICVNGFAKKFLPESDVIPSRAQVLITSPIDNLNVKGSFHYDQGYYYFRNVGNRVLFGGGRNLDFTGETTEEMNLTPLIQAQLEKLLKEMILPENNFTVEMRWSGIMGLGTTKSPVIKKTGENIYCAVRLGGMGVAIGTRVGEEVAGLVYESM